MNTEQDIITDAQIQEVWGNADFGQFSQREIIAKTLLKCACGYTSGKIARYIVEDLGLVTADWKLSQRGEAYLYAAYQDKYKATNC